MMITQREDYKVIITLSMTRHDYPCEKIKNVTETETENVTQRFANR